jgi:geranylgeranyl diphosphate synthase type II
MDDRFSPAAYLDDRKARVDKALREVLPGPEAPPALLHQAIHYSLFAGGKRLRPILALAAAEAVGAEADALLPLVAPLELIHTYSLIHDDLPAMDDDDLRRGIPTNHRVYGEDLAILAGDALQALAFGLLADPHRAPTICPEARLAAVYELAVASGSGGLVGGQVLDLRTPPPPEPTPSDGPERASALATLDGIHARKTGALIRAAVRIGAILGGATSAQLAALSRYGEGIGLAFQIADDLLDVDATPEEMGKATHKDGRHHKWAYPGVVGREASRTIAQRWIDGALDAIGPFDERAEPLRGLARFILDRRS